MGILFKLTVLLRKYFIAWIIPVTCLTLLVSCTASSPAPSPSDRQGITTHQLAIDILGTKYGAPANSQGELQASCGATSADGTVSITMDKGTLLITKDEKPLEFIQVTKEPTPPDTPEDTYIVSAVYDLKPQGAIFQPSIMLTISYDSESLPQGVMEDDVYIAHYENNNWDTMRYKQVDTNNHRITTMINSSGKYTVLIQEIQSTPSSLGLADRVDVVYFHRAKRCYSCIWAEEQIQLTLETYFRDELNNGKLTFNTVNVQDPNNAAIIKKYHAYGSQLFINTVRGNQEYIEEVVGIWPFVGHDEGFAQIVRDEITEALGSE